MSEFSIDHPTNTLHYHFNTYIKKHDEDVKKRNEQYLNFNPFEERFDTGQNIASSVKGVKNMIRSAHHLQKFFINQSKFPYHFYYKVNDDDIQYLGKGYLSTSVHLGTQSLTTVTTKTHKIKIYYKMHNFNNTRFNLEYNKSYNKEKSNCQITIIIKDIYGKEEYRNCPYVSTLNEDYRDQYISSVITNMYKKSSLTSAQEENKLLGEKFFMFRVDDNGSRQISYDKKHNKQENNTNPKLYDAIHEFEKSKKNTVKNSETISGTQFSYTEGDLKNKQSPDDLKQALKESFVNDAEKAGFPVTNKRMFNVVKSNFDEIVNAIANEAFNDETTLRQKILEKLTNSEIGPQIKFVIESAVNKEKNVIRTTGGKKRSKRKRVSRRKNRKSRGTKKNRKHAKTRKSRR